MDEITAMFQLTNLSDVIMSIFVILFGVLAIMKVIEEVSKRIGKPVKWISEQNKDHELLQQTIQGLQELTDRHKADVDDEADRDELMEDKFTRLAEEMRDCITQTQAELKQFSENRASDRAQSFEIQKQLSSSIEAMAVTTGRQDAQIQSLMQGMMELLGDKIDQRFSKYISLGGIPENELSEFTGIYNAYAATGGNSTRKEKYEYVINHMKVIPVETSLLIQTEE